MSEIVQVEVSALDGRTYRIDPDEFTGAQFRTQRGDGFADGSVVILNRKLDLDYADLQLLSTARLIGADGEIAYEGRAQAIPRSLNDRTEFVLSMTGWMSHGRDRPFAEFIIDQDLSRWREPPLERRAYLASNKYIFGRLAPMSDNGTGAITFETAPTTDFERGPTEGTDPFDIGEIWYMEAAATGQKVGALSYRIDGKELYSLEFVLHATDNRDGTGGETYDHLASSGQFSGGPGSGVDDTLTSLTLTTPRTYIFLQVTWASWTQSNLPKSWLAGDQPRGQIKNLAVYGDQGLDLRSVADDEPDGVFGSDAITDIASRFCPLLDPSGVQGTSYPISHLAFTGLTDPYDAFTQINDLHSWELGVWEGRRLTFGPANLGRYDWQVRTDDPGVRLDLQGDATDRVANGIAVGYEDLAVGPTILWPDEHDELRDDDPLNPWNQLGVAGWTPLPLPYPTIEAQALQIGSVALAEFNRPKAPGQITLNSDEILDGDGHTQAAWKVRAGQTISITNHPNDRPRLISETSWDEDSKTLGITLEQPSSRVDAVLGRVQSVLAGRGLQ
jgi:hypothetical protein